MTRLSMSVCGAMGGVLAALLISSPAMAQENPFSRFVGEWTLKDDRFQQVWDGSTVETLTIPDHHTDCQPVNTQMSILCVVEAPDLKGHIFWAFDGASGEVQHLSHFGTARLGTGQGRLSEAGDLTLTLRFRDEPAGTYRIYEYVWVSDNEYEMISRQYDAAGAATGNWYGGSFVRVPAR